MHVHISKQWGVVTFLYKFKQNRLLDADCGLFLKICFFLDFRLLDTDCGLFLRICSCLDFRSLLKNLRVSFFFGTIDSVAEEFGQVSKLDLSISVENKLPLISGQNRSPPSDLLDWFRLMRGVLDRGNRAELDSTLKSWLIVHSRLTRGGGGGSAEPTSPKQRVETSSMSVDENPRNASFTDETKWKWFKLYNQYKN